MAKLKKVSVGNIIQVPGPVFRRNRRGSQHIFNHAIVKRVYMSRNGPAIEVDEAFRDSKIVGKKYLIERCRQSVNALYTPEYFDNLPIAKPTPFYK